MKKLLPAIIIVSMILSLIGVDVGIILYQCFDTGRVLFILSNIALVVLMIFATYFVKE